MARQNEVVQFVQQETKEFSVLSGVGYAGPYAVNGVEAVAAFADFSGGSGTILVQRSGQKPSVADDDLKWVDITTLTEAGGLQQEFQSGQKIASLYRLVVTPTGGSIRTHWVSGSRNL